MKAFRPVFSRIILSIFNLNLYINNQNLEKWSKNYSLCVFNTMHFTSPWMHYMQFTRITFQLIPIFIFLAIYSTIFFKVRGSGIQGRNHTHFVNEKLIVKEKFESKRVIKMSLKSNSGTSTSDDSTVREDDPLVKKSSDTFKPIPKIITRTRSDVEIPHPVCPLTKTVTTFYRKTFYFFRNSRLRIPFA